MNRLSDTDIEWIEARSKADAAQLRLKHHGDEHATWLVMQLECRRKAASKLPATLANKRFVFPTSLSAEQCTSEAVATIHARFLKQAGTVLDMTCGLGVDAFCASRVSSEVTAIDIDQAVAEAAKVNAATMGLDNIEVINADSIEWLGNNDRRFDTIFIDPARRGEGGKRLFALADCKPDVIENLELLKSRCDTLLIKASPMLDITVVTKEAGPDCDIIIIGTADECKELVVKLPGTGLITAITTGNEKPFTFTRDEESTARTACSIPSVGSFLYEPFPAMIKAGSFKTIAKRLEVEKLDPNVHLYHSKTSVADFPGHEFRIIDIIPFSKKAIKEVATRYQKISVTTKNFKMTAARLSAQLKNRESSTTRLFAVTACDQTLMIIAERT